MQVSTKEYNPELHDIYKALCVKQPYADRLLTPAFQEGGIILGEKSIELRSRPTKYRGELLICSSASPVIPGRISGAAIGFVELYDVKPISEFTEQDWKDTTISSSEREKIKKGYGWFMRNPRRVIEVPIKGQLGIFKLVCDKDEIFEYPRVCKVDSESWKIIKKRIKNEKK